MLAEVLKLIERNGYISRGLLAEELGVTPDAIDRALSDLLRMGYLAEEASGADCVSTCTSCPFAKNCGKEIVKMFTVTEKGKGYLAK